MKAASFVGVLLALAGCAQAATKVAPDTKEIAVTGPAVEATFAGIVPGKPPMMTVQVDLLLRNSDKAARWFVLPLRLPADEGAATGGVTGVEVFDVSGEGRAVVGKFLGSAGFQAVLVAPGGEVKLSRFGITTWQKLAAKSPLAIDVTIASEITVGGQPAATWFGATSPVSDVRASGDVSKGKRAGSKMTDDRDEVPVVFADARQVTVSVVVP